jgi:hypothetical protein
MICLLVFLAAVLIVFMLGFQSLNVNRGHYWLACLTSLGIGTANLCLLKIIPQAKDPLEIACYLVGGPIGILLAMWLHPSRRHKV